MGLKSTCIQQCITGDILATDVYGINGKTLLVTKETELNDYIKERLMNLGVKKVFIYEAMEQVAKKCNTKCTIAEVYKETIIKTKKLFQEIVRGNSLNIDDIMWIADNIGLFLRDNQNILHCMSYVENRDEYTYVHSINVAFYSMLIAKWLQLSPDEVKNVLLAGLLHDVGKVMIPLNILNKPNKLTREEFNIIKRHTEYGYEIVSQMDELNQDIKYAVLLHHERMDGSGYPFGYQGENLNLYTRIVAIADVFDAMTSKRVYKDKSTPFEVFEMMQEDGISVFDYQIMDVFIKHIANYLTGLEVMLSNHEVGRIVYVPLHNVSRPVVCVSGRYLDLSKIKAIHITKIMN